MLDTLATVPGPIISASVIIIVPIIITGILGVVPGGIRFAGVPDSIIVREPWLGRLPPPGNDEKGMLEFAAEPARPNSRLSCQIRLTDALDGLTVDLPATQY